MSELKNIWSKPIYLPFLQPPLTPELIENAEKLIGYPLPKDYIELMYIQNGGAIRSRIKDTMHNKIFGIGPYYPSITDFFDSDDTVLKGLASKRLYPFDQEGDEYICFDYPYNGKEPRITALSPSLGYRFTVAKDFSSYLKKLRLDLRGKWIIYTSKSLPNFIKEISIDSNITYEELSSEIHGYTIFKFIEEGYNIYINSNIVPKGNIKREHVRREEFREILAENALQYPEIQDDCLIIACTENTIANKFLKVVKSYGYKTESLRAAINKTKTLPKK